MTAHLLVEVQHQRWTAVILLPWHRKKLLSKNTVTWQLSTLLLQHFPMLSWGTRSYAFSRWTNLCKGPYSQDFSKICWRVNISSVVLRPGQKLHWVSSSFGSIISWHCFSRHMAYTFPGRLRRGTPQYLGRSLLSLFCVWRWSPQFANLSVLFQNTKLPNTHESAKKLLDTRLWAF